MWVCVVARADAMQHHRHVCGLSQGAHRCHTPGSDRYARHCHLQWGLLHVAVQKHEELGLPAGTPQVQGVGCRKVSYSDWLDYVIFDRVGSIMQLLCISQPYWCPGISVVSIRLIIMIDKWLCYVTFHSLSYIRLWSFHFSLVLFYPILLREGILSDCNLFAYIFNQIG